MIRLANRLWAEEEGATMVEYSLMVAMIAAAAIAVVGSLSSALNAKINSVTSALG